MARKSTKKNSKAKKSSGSTIKNTRSYFSQIKIGDSYVSLALGALVVLVVAAVLVIFLRRGGLETSNFDRDQSKTTSSERTHTVKEGEWLTSIAEQEYGNLDYWRQIAEANNIDNPDNIEVGMILKLPDIIPQGVYVTPGPTQAQEMQQSPQQRTYTVLEGEGLWDIAVKIYGDGNRWVDVAQLNNLQNPDILVAGQVLVLP